MTNLTVEFKKGLEGKVKELTDLLEAKDFEATIVASEELTIYLKECSQLCASSERIVERIQNFAEDELEKTQTQPVINNTVIDDSSLEALFKRVNPTFGVPTEEEKGHVGIFKGWLNAGKKKVKAVE